MQTIKIPIFSEVYQNADKVELNDKSRTIIDGYVSELGAIVARPGLRFVDSLSVAGTMNGQILGQYVVGNNLVAAYSGDKLRSYTYDGTTLAGFPTTTVGITNGLPTWTTGRLVSTDTQYYFFANGGSIYYTSGGTTWTAIADVDAPTTVTHIGWIDGYLICNRANSNRINFADLDDPFSWSALSVFRANADGDNVNAIKVRNRELFVFGVNSIEIWENDGVTPFSRVPGGFIETGCVAPYSIISDDTGLFWLGSNRRFVRWQGRGVEYVSSPYDKVIQSYSYVGDCVGNRVQVAGADLFIFKFLTEGKTLVYNATSERWSEFGKYNGELPGYEGFLGLSPVYLPNLGTWLFGSTQGGNILKFDPTYGSDYSSAVSTKRLFHQTGFIDHGSSKLKRSHEIRLRTKRGFTWSSATAPRLMVRWNDDNRGWSQEHWFDLGDQGETGIIGRLFRTGMYRARQWEFSLSDAVQGIYLDAEEDVEFLR